MSKIKLSVVIPCYNEAENIPLILERFDQVINRKDVEVVLVDNGSTDNSSEVLGRLLPQYSFSRSVFVEVNQGYGYGILQGLKACNGEFLGWTHADMQTDPKDVIKALNIIEENGSSEDLFVKGDRKGRPLFDNFFTVGMSIFESIYLGERLYEINAQPNIFSRKFYNRWKNPPHDFALDLYVLYMAKVYKQKIYRFDVIFPERVYGVSKWNDGILSKWRFIKRTINFSVNLKKML